MILVKSFVANHSETRHRLWLLKLSLVTLEAIRLASK